MAKTVVQTLFKVIQDVDEPGFYTLVDVPPSNEAESLLIVFEGKLYQVRPRLVGE